MYVRNGVYNAPPLSIHFPLPSESKLNLYCARFRCICVWRCQTGDKRALRLAFESPSVSPRLCVAFLRSIGINYQLRRQGRQHQREFARFFFPPSLFDVQPEAARIEFRWLRARRISQFLSRLSSARESKRFPEDDSAAFTGINLRPRNASMKSIYRRADSPLSDHPPQPFDDSPSAPTTRLFLPLWLAPDSRSRMEFQRWSESRFPPRFCFRRF